MAIPLEQARALVLDRAAPLPTEAVPVAEAAGRVLAEELRARHDSPPQASSAMDGFAVIAGPAGRTLRLVGESRAGAPSRETVGPGTAIRIATGGVLPAGADAVVAVELAAVDGDSVTVHEAAAPGRNVRRAGEDIRTGQILIAPGTSIGAVELAVAIGGGHGELVCHRRPRVALLATGDELREPGGALAPGQIHESNAIVIAALVRSTGAAVTTVTRVGDEAAAIGRELRRAFDDRADLVVVSGGVSVGPHDHVRGALAALGAEECFWGVAIRPGRPIWFGHRGGTLVLGLPGNPVSALVAFVLLGRPLLRDLAGAPEPARRERARLSAPVTRRLGRTEVVRVGLRTVDGLGLEAAPGGSPGSHMTTSMLGAGGLALIPPGQGELEAGSEVDVERL
ncbi:MAG: molybdopterin molybdotransferase MoeA [Solirubrobacteraceae bacterium]